MLVANVFWTATTKELEGKPVSYSLNYPKCLFKGMKKNQHTKLIKN